MKKNMFVGLLPVIVLLSAVFMLFAPSVGAGPIEDGLAALQAQDAAKAEAAFRAAVAAEPQSVRAHLGLGLALLHQDRVAEGIAALQSAERLAPEDANVAYALGKAYWAARRDQEAVACFERVKRLAPGRQDLDVFLGAAQLRLGQNREALKLLEGAAASTAEMRATKSVLEGVALSRLGDFEAATVRFRNAMQAAPVSPAARTADKFQALVQAPGYGERFRGSLRAALHYDDNATLVPSRNVFGLRDEEHQTGGNMFDLNLAYDLIQETGRSLTFDYNLYQTLNWNFDNADLQDHTFKLHGLHTDTDSLPIPFQLGYQVGGDYLTVAGNSSLARGMVLPYLVLIETPRTSTMVVTRAQWKNFLGQGRLDNSADDRDAVNLFTGITQRYSIPEKNLGLWIGYLRDADVAQGRNWDYDGNIVHAGIQWVTPCKGIVASTIFQYHDRDYSSPHTFFGVERSDREYTFSVNLRYPVNACLSVYTEYLRDRNNSDIAIFDYSRDLFMVGLDYRF